MKGENTLMAYEENIKSRNFWDWIKAHTSFMKPLHKYKGVLKLYEQKMTFTGKDVKVDNLEIATGDITDIHLNDVFTGWEDGAAPWNKPLRAI